MSEIYDRAIEDDSNKIKIFEILKKDSYKENLSNKYMNNDQKINIPRNLEQSEEESINNGNSKEILIKDRILDENQIRALQNKNKNKQNERDINVSDFNSNIRIIDKNEIDPVYKMFNSQINYAKFHSNAIKEIIVHIFFI